MAEYIEREALRADIRESYDKLLKIHNGLVDQHAIDLCRTELITFCEVLLRIKDFPAADVAPVVHGRWVYDEHEMEYSCSVCLHNAPVGMTTYYTTNYCPNCGARMDGE